MPHDAESALFLIFAMAGSTSRVRMRLDVNHRGWNVRPLAIHNASSPSFVSVPLIKRPHWSSIYIASSPFLISSPPRSLTSHLISGFIAQLLRSCIDLFALFNAYVLVMPAATLFNAFLNPATERGIGHCQWRRSPKVAFARDWRTTTFMLCSSGTGESNSDAFRYVLASQRLR